MIIKLPPVRVGYIRDINWTNGNRIFPSNPIDIETIQNFTELHEYKINWTDNNNGLITLEGHYNYLIYNNGEFFFLEKIKVHDIEKDKYTYALIRDIKQYYLSYTQLEISGCLSKTNKEDTLWKHLQKTKPLIGEPNSFNYIPTIGGKSQAIKGLINFRTDQIKNYWVYKEDLKTFLKTIAYHYSQEEQNRLPYVREKPFQVLASLPLRHVRTYQEYIAELLKDFLSTDQDDLKIVNLTDFATRYGALNNKLRNIHGLKQVLAIKKVSDSDSIYTYGDIFSHEVEKRSLVNMDFSEIDEIRLINNNGSDYVLNNKSIFDLPSHGSYQGPNPVTFNLKAKYYGKSYVSKEVNPYVHPKLFNLKISLHDEKLKTLGLYDVNHSNALLSINYYPSYLWNQSFTSTIYNLLKTNFTINYDSKLGFNLYSISKYNNTLFAVPYSNIYYGDTTTKLKFITGLNLKEVKDSCDVVLNVNEATQAAGAEVSFQDLYSHLTELQGIWFVLNTFFINGTTDLFNYLNGNVAEKIAIYENTCTYTGKENTLITSKNYLIYSLQHTALTSHVYHTYNPLGNDYQKQKFKALLNRIEKRREQIEIVEEFESPGFSLNKGDVYWSNVDFDLNTEQNNSTITTHDGPSLLFLYDNNRSNDLHSYGFRLGVLDRFNFNLGLSKKPDNLIRSVELKTEDINNNVYFPWVYRVQNFLNTSSTTHIGASYTNVYKTRITTSINNFVNELLGRSTRGSKTGTSYLIKKIVWVKGYDQYKEWDKDKLWGSQIKETIKDAFRFEGKHSNEFRAPRMLQFRDNYERKISTTKKSFFGRTYTETTGENLAKMWISDRNGNEILQIIFYTDVDWDYQKSCRDLFYKYQYQWDDIWNNQEQFSGWNVTSGIREFHTKLKVPLRENKSEFFSNSLSSYIEENNSSEFGNLDVLLHELALRYAPDLGAIKNDSTQAIKYTQIDEAYFKSNNTHPFIFRLSKGGNLIAYAVIQWFAEKTKPTIEIILVDQSKIEYEAFDNLTVSDESLTLTNIVQAINQKNILYVYGQKLPIQTRLATNKGKVPFELDIMSIAVPDSTAAQKYKVYFKSALDCFEEILTVPKKIAVSPTQAITSVDIENLKLTQEQRAKQKLIDLELNSEQARLMYQNQANRESDFQYEASKNTLNKTNIVSSGAAGVIGGFGAGAAVGSIIPGLGTLVGGVIGGAIGVGKSIQAGFNSAQEWANSNRSLEVGQRGIDQGAYDMSRQVYLQKYQLDNTHYFQEQNEKMQILRMANNSSNWVSTDADATEYLNKLILLDDQQNSAIINKLPVDELLEEMTGHYERFGVDVFINNYAFSINDIDRDKTTIIQFQEVDSLAVEDSHIREQLKSLFLNGVMFKKINYEVITEDRLKQYQLHEKIIEERKKKLEEDKKEKRRLELEEIKAAEEVRQKVLNNLNLITAELTELKETKEKLEQEKEALQGEIDKQKALTESCSTSLTESQSDLALKEEELKNCKTDNKTKDASIKQLTSQKNTLDENFKNLTQQNTLLEQQKATLQTEASKVPTLNAEITRLKARNSNLTKQTNTANSKAQSLQDALTECQNTPKGCTEIDKALSKLITAGKILKLAFKSYHNFYCFNKDVTNFNRYIADNTGEFNIQDSFKYRSIQWENFYPSGDNRWTHHDITGGIYVPTTKLRYTEQEGHFVGRNGRWFFYKKYTFGSYRPSYGKRDLIVYGAMVYKRSEDGTNSLSGTPTKWEAGETIRLIEKSYNDIIDAVAYLKTQGITSIPNGLENPFSDWSQ